MVTDRSGWSTVFVDQSMVNVYWAQTGTNGLDFGPSWARLGRPGVDMCHTPRLSTWLGGLVGYYWACVYGRGSRSSRGAWVQ